MDQPREPTSTSEQCDTAWQAMASQQTTQSVSAQRHPLLPLSPAATPSLPRPLPRSPPAPHCPHVNLFERPPRSFLIAAQSQLISLSIAFDHGEAAVKQSAMSSQLLTASSLSAYKAQEQKECIIPSTEEQPEPDWLHLPLRSGARTFDTAEQLFDVSRRNTPATARR